MRSVTKGAETRDLTARARIRDAAVAVFGREGSRSTVRAVAVECGVSPALVIHHFGSKAALLAECDAHVLAEIRSIKTHHLIDVAPGSIVDVLASIDDFVPLLAYVLRSLQAGGAMASSFVDQMVADALVYTDEAVRAGVMRPSRDPEGRARYMVLQNLGLLMLLATLDVPDPDGSGAGVQGARAAAHQVQQRFALPALEILTDGVLTDRAMLDAYLEQVPDPLSPAVPDPS